MYDTKRSEQNQTRLRGGGRDISTNTDIEYTYTHIVNRLMYFNRYRPVNVINEIFIRKTGVVSYFHGNKY